MVRIVTRVAIGVAIIAATYLVAVNVALNLSATQALFNKTQEGRIVVSWDRAWSWLPFRLTVTNLKVNGQSWAQQFDIEVPQASAGIDVPALFTRTLRFNDVETADLTVRFRPRPREDRDDNALRQFYPEIPGRDPNLAADAKPTQSPGWLTVFDVQHIGGSNDLWFGANRMTLDGTASAFVVRQNRHGPLAISDGRIDVKIANLSIAGKKVSDTGTLVGDFAFQSFIPQDNRGAKILEHLTLNADVDLPIDGIDFLNNFLGSVADMSVGGKGHLTGRMAYSLGALVPGANLRLDADTLRVNLVPYTVRGKGSALVKIDPDNPDEIDAHLAFATIEATFGGQEGILFQGTDIGIDVVRSAIIAPEELTEQVPRKVSLTLPEVVVPDVCIYQRYLPDEWNAQLVGGTGSLTGKAMLSREAAEFDLTLRSDDAEVRLTHDTFQSGLAVGMRAKGMVEDNKASLDVAGTFIELDDSRVTGRSGDQSRPWKASFAISEGRIDYTLPDDQDEKTGVVGFWSLFQKSELKTILSNIDGQARGKLVVSDLDWVSLLFRKPFSLQIAQAAEVDADLSVTKGRLTTDSSLTLPPTQFTLGILDYIISGTGGFAINLTRSDQKPDLSLAANLTGASLRLQNEKTAVVSNVTIKAEAHAEGVSPKDGGTLKSVVMSIPSATITDLAAYNTYLPSNAPVKILNGTAKLDAQLTMQGTDNAKGYMRLTSSRVDADVMGDRISGVIDLDVKIPSGSAEARRFDIGGSKLTLSDVQVTGRHATGGWTGTANISKGSVLWKQPMSLDMTAAIHMKDAQPILAIFQANRKENKWLDRLLDLRNINGTVTLATRPDSITVPYAFATSDTFDIGAKGIFGKSGNQGLFYARTGKLAGILAIDGKTKKFELIDATGKFENYKPGGPVPGIHDQRKRATSSRGIPPPSPHAQPAPAQKPFSLFKKKR